MTPEALDASAVHDLQLTTPTHTAPAVDAGETATAIPTENVEQSALPSTHDEVAGSGEQTMSTSAVSTDAASCDNLTDVTTAQADDSSQTAEPAASGESITGPVVSVTSEDSGTAPPIIADGSTTPLQHTPSDLSAVQAEVAAEESSPADDISALREKVLQARGSRAELPPGWDDEMQGNIEETQRVDDASGSKAGLDVDSDTDSDSDSGSSSSDSDSSDDEFTARVAQMAGEDYDYDSEEESGKDKAGTGAKGPATKNELPQDKVTKLFGELPFTEVPAEAMNAIKPLGKVHGHVEEVLVIAQFEEKVKGSHDASSSSGAPLGYNDRGGPVLDAGSLVCLPTGKVLGLVFETFGSLLSPLYSVILSSASEAASYPQDQPVFYLPSHSSVLRPAELRAQQGKPSDASNVHDEEPNAWDVDAMDFSDDEEEAEWKRRVKEKKRSNKRAAEVMDGGGDAETALSGGLATGHAAKASRGSVARGRGRGRGASSAAGGLTGPASLPPRPRWHPDDPSAGADAALSSLPYDGPGHVDHGASGPEGNVSEEKPLSKPPPSAGLPLNPMLASAAVPKKPLATVGVPIKPPSEAIAGAQSGNSPASGSDHPPPGAHINPLFAHRWGVTSGSSVPTTSAPSPLANQIAGYHTTHQVQSQPRPYSGNYSTPSMHVAPSQQQQQHHHQHQHQQQYQHSYYQHQTAPSQSAYPSYAGPASQVASTASTYPYQWPTQTSYPGSNQVFQQQASAGYPQPHLHQNNGQYDHPAHTAPVAGGGYDPSQPSAATLQHGSRAPYDHASASQSQSQSPYPTSGNTWYGNPQSGHAVNGTSVAYPNIEAARFATPQQQSQSQSQGPSQNLALYDQSAQQQSPYQQP
ncbi:unnamed protein product [Parajaminaea phylloscopi]